MAGCAGCRSMYGVAIGVVKRNRPAPACPPLGVSIDYLGWVHRR